jgi:hypothetical protein
MKEDKKPDAYSENARLLPYGSDLSAPAIKLDDIDSWNLDKTKKANNYFSTKFEEIKKQYESLVDEMNWSELIFNSGYKFEPIIGKSYFLYQKDDEVFLSMVTPKEWSLKCLGEFKMTTDNIWRKIS